MRPVFHGDVVAAARVLFGLPMDRRAPRLERLMDMADRADLHRRLTGRSHPDWGDGSLMAVALKSAPPPEPRLDERDYCACLAMVFEALVLRPLNTVIRARN